MFSSLLCICFPPCPESSTLMLPHLPREVTGRLRAGQHYRAHGGDLNDGSQYQGWSGRAGRGVTWVCFFGGFQEDHTNRIKRTCSWSLFLECSTCFLGFSINCVTLEFFSLLGTSRRTKTMKNLRSQRDRTPDRCKGTRIDRVAKLF